jgi:hypothetical protein
LDEKEHEVYKWVLCICSNAEQDEKCKCSFGVLEQIQWNLDPIVFQGDGENKWWMQEND